MKMTFFPGTVARASLIALCEAGADFEPVLVDFSASAQTQPDYLSVNPKGRVPALITDDGVLTETIAILGYIAARFPEAELAPSEPWARAKVDEVMAYLASTVHVNHAHKMRGYRWATREESFADMQAKVTENMAESFQLIEDDYLAGPWVLGERYSIADAYLFAVASWLKGDGVTLETMPKVAAHMATMKERAAVKQALEIEAVKGA